MTITRTYFGCAVSHASLRPVSKANQSATHSKGLLPIIRFDYGHGVDLNVSTLPGSPSKATPPCTSSFRRNRRALVRRGTDRARHRDDAAARGPRLFRARLQKAARSPGPTVSNCPPMRCTSGWRPAAPSSATRPRAIAAAPTLRHAGLVPGPTGPQPTALDPAERWMPEQARHDGNGISSRCLFSGPPIPRHVPQHRLDRDHRRTIPALRETALDFRPLPRLVPAILRLSITAPHPARHAAPAR
jgi:hypothetical protein